MNSKMFLTDPAENEERSAKRRRCLIINEEIFVEEGKYLIPLKESKHREEVQTGVENTSSANLEIRESSISSKNCDNIKVYSNGKNSGMGQHDKRSETNCTDNEDDDSSDDMIIISDDEQLLEKTVTEVNDDKLSDNDSGRNTVSEINNDKLSDNDSRRKMSSLVRLIENRELSKNVKPKKGDVRSVEDNNSKITGQPARVIVHRVKNGTTDSFSIRFIKKISLPSIGDNHIKQTDSCMKNFFECPYCNFKVSKGKIAKHLVSKHIEAGYCTTCDSARTCSKLINHRHKGRHNLKCMKCSFETDSHNNLHKHLILSHRDLIFRQCGICGKMMEKTKTSEEQIWVLVEHVKSIHLLPEEKTESVTDC